MKKLYALASTLFFAAIPTIAATSNGVDVSGAPGIDITINSLFNILAGLACWGSRFAMIFMVIVILWYGIQFMLAQGDPGKFGKARTSLMHAVIGILVIMGAYTIIATVANSVQSLAPNAPTKSAQYTYFIPIQCGSYQ